MRDSQWTAERDTLLRSLWAGGDSSADIAAMMRTTKNAVVGRAHRLGLAARASPIIRDPNRPAQPHPVPRRHTATVPLPEPIPAVPVVPCVSNPSTRAPADHRKVAETSGPPARPLIAFGGRSLMRLMKTAPGRAARCQWIEGEAKGAYAEGRFCAAVSVPGWSYCARHAAICGGNGTPAERGALKVLKAHAA